MKMVWDLRWMEMRMHPRSAEDSCVGNDLT
jgi:hypothetical protein